jgi:poly [ADP-ribose] polymerase
MNISTVFEVEREGETERFAPWGKNTNRKLLWHGSGLQNWVGILSQGLRIAPPEAPAAGYLFGKGVYFADMLEKSLNYCRLGADTEAVLQLSEVALGESYVLKAPEFSAPETARTQGKQSTFCTGQTQPDPRQDHLEASGTVIPVGAPVANADAGHMSHNEFIVYDESQVKARYIVCLKRC